MCAMSPLTVIILSKEVSNLIPCVEAVVKHEPDVEIVIMDDGIEWEQIPPYWDHYRVVPGLKPFIFARNANLGIEAAKVDGEYSDVVLLNDDAILETPGGFRIMQEAAERFPASIGLVAATTNITNNPAQMPSDTGKRRILDKPAPGMSMPCVAFVCVLIPGRTLRAVGLLDEQFTAYGWEDTDYCRRVHNAHLLIAVDDRCFVDHSKLKSTFRGDPRATGPIEQGKLIFLEKWGRL